MEKKHLALRVQEKASALGIEIPREDVETIIAVLFDPNAGVVVDCLNGQGELTIPRFGRFRVHQRPSRQGRNPRTGESLVIPAKRTVKFKASRILARVLTK